MNGDKKKVQIFCEIKTTTVLIEKEQQRILKVTICKSIFNEKKIF